MRTVLSGLGLLSALVLLGGCGAKTSTQTLGGPVAVAAPPAQAAPQSPANQTGMDSPGYKKLHKQ